jgi:hypothetical protein
MSHERAALRHEAPEKTMRIVYGGGRTHNGSVRGYIEARNKVRELLQKVEYAESPENVSLVASLFDVNGYEALNIIRRKHILDLKRARESKIPTSR